MTYPFSKLQQAVSFAARAHQGQLRKDGKTPYASHPYRVCLVAREVFGIQDHEVLTAAILHDTIEDTTTDYDDIAEAFGHNVARWVAALSKDKRLIDHEREEVYCRAIAAGGPEVHLLKLADIYDNLSDVEQLPAERRPQTLKRARYYLDHIKSQITAETKLAYDAVTALLGSLS
ncbi:MAG: HD domain-containing protein [Gemmataceae bacterium]|nr:HD domain-containing protein [Gemmataceae bacterium]